MDAALTTLFEGKNTLLFDKQLELIIYVLNTAMEFLREPLMEGVFQWHKTFGHPSVTACQTKDCGPFTLYWENTVMAFNDPSVPQLPEYITYKALIVSIDWILTAALLSIPMYIAATTYEQKFIGILRLQKQEFRLVQTFEEEARVPEFSEDAL